MPDVLACTAIIEMGERGSSSGPRDGDVAAFPLASCAQRHGPSALVSTRAS